MISSTEPDIVDIEDKLADFTADLLTLSANERILERLLEEPASSWSNLASFLEGHQQATQAVQKFQADCDGILQVPWLAHPKLDRGYCLVPFYVEALGWNNLAAYNRARLQRKT